jgi:hypothetical protein
MDKTKPFDLKKAREQLRKEEEREKNSFWYRQYKRLYRFFWRFIDELHPRTNINRIKFLFQKITRGYSDRETWDLGWEVANFVSPRIKRLKELNNGIPGTVIDGSHPEGLKEDSDEYHDYYKKKWDETLDKIAEAMDIIKDDDFYDESDVVGYQKKQEAKVKEGLGLFAEYFQSLWW